VEQGLVKDDRAEVGGGGEKEKDCVLVEVPNPNGFTLGATAFRSVNLHMETITIRRLTKCGERVWLCGGLPTLGQYMALTHPCILILREPLLRARFQVVRILGKWNNFHLQHRLEQAKTKYMMLLHQFCDKGSTQMRTCQT